METIFAIISIVLGACLIIVTLVPKYRPLIGAFAALIVILYFVARMIKK